ncbi:MAG: NTP transferase domain-containing protein [Desulfobacteraceae bacterium]|nr:NTP transferase domain-containing protein [Desulfobacteraceae bacterium]
MPIIASVIFAAGKGSRMTGYAGNKTLLPLLPDRSVFEGSRPLLQEVIENLPPGPKCIVVNHCAGEVESAFRQTGAVFVLQKETNGTGGALLAARDFLTGTDADSVIITMGDVPLIRPETYRGLLGMLDRCDMAILGFEPANRAQYGMLHMDGERVAGIVEWKYWKEYKGKELERLRYCNAGVYAAKRGILLKYLLRLGERPHKVVKSRNGEMVTISEYFLTDLAEMMHEDGLFVGMAPASESEVTGVDTPENLAAVQKIYTKRLGLKP